MLLLACTASAAEKKWIPADRAVACAEATDKDLCGRPLTLLDRDQLPRYADLNDPDNPQHKEDIARADTRNIAENVDARRKSVGLGPLAEYTALLRQMHAQNKQ